MKPQGCTVIRLEPRQVEAILRAVVEGDGLPEGLAGLRWLLATCHDGVVWGELRDGGLALSSAAFPEVSPTPRRESLLELRLFGPAAEIRVWRTDDGFAVRRIESAGGETSAALAGSPAEPKRESWLLVGDRFRDARDGFTLVTGDGGKRQAVPLTIDEDRSDQDLPVRLEVCHHLEQDGETGAVRVALTRLTGLAPAGRAGGREGT